MKSHPEIKTDLLINLYEKRIISLEKELKERGSKWQS
jgi:predicted HTH domain antitoxin